MKPAVDDWQPECSVSDRREMTETKMKSHKPHRIFILNFYFGKLNLGGSLRYRHF